VSLLHNDDCKFCRGTGWVSGNGARRQCPVCNGWGYIPYVQDDPSPPLTFKQSACLWAVAAIIILLALVGGNPWAPS
jgi:DnaJ-class molecular chaperone